MTDSSPHDPVIKSPTAKGSHQPRRRFNRAGLGLLAGGALVVAGLGGVYVYRAAVAESAAKHWLARYGIDADIAVERLEWDGFVGSAIIGDPASPDVRIERIEVDYDVSLPWARNGAGVQPKRVRLTQPLIKASWIDGRFSVGALDKLIEDLTSKPSTSDQPGPLIIIEQGRADIRTDYGTLSLLADARVNDGRLEALDARLPSLALKHATLNAEGLSGQIKAVGDARTLRFEGQLAAGALSVSQSAMQAQAASLTFTGSVPYPAKGVQALAGDAALSADFAAGRFVAGDYAATSATGQLSWQGQLQGWLEAFTATGQGRLDVKSGELRGLDADIRDARLQLSTIDMQVERAKGEAVNWSLRTPLGVSAQQARIGNDFKGLALGLTSSQISASGAGKNYTVRGPLDLRAGNLSGADAGFDNLSGRLQLDVMQGDSLRIDVSGNLQSPRARYAGLGAVTRDDVAELAVIKRALGDFSLSLADVRFSSDGQSQSLRLMQPARLRPRSGGQAVLSQISGPVLTTDGSRISGAGHLVVSGGSLPQVDAVVSRWQMASGALEAQLRLRGRLDMGPARGLALDTAGTVSMAGGRGRYSSSSCSQVQVSQLLLGENALSDIAGKLCPQGGVLARFDAGDWALDGRLIETGLSADFLELDLENGRGPIKVASSRANLAVSLDVEHADLSDSAVARRFEPLTAAGRLDMQRNRLNGQFALKSGYFDVGSLCLGHDMATAQGGLGITTAGGVCAVPAHPQSALAAPQGGLRFAEGGLQLADITPFGVGLVNAPVRGEAAFVGQMHWSAEGLTSAGQASLRGLSFVSPVGEVSGGEGDIVFSSLVPLEAAPGQRVRFSSVQGPLPMRDLDVNFSLKPDALMVHQASVKLAEGELYLFDAASYALRADSFALPAREIAGGGLMVPFDISRPWQFGVAVNAIQMNALVQAFGAGDKASMDAVVSGVLPVSYRLDWGFAISDGMLLADRRGSLEIAPEVLGSVDANAGTLSASDGQTEAVPRNIMQDLAYQALEHLTFTDLSAAVNSVCQPRRDNSVDADGFISIYSTQGELCHTIEAGRAGWIPSRLALDFTINGYYDPPQRREMRVSLWDVIKGRFMDKPMVLPSDTPVTLTLRTSINAYDLASQVMDYVRLRNETPELP